MDGRHNLRRDHTEVVDTMKPVLFAPTATTFETNGLGKLSDAASCTVKETRNGAFELTLKYPVEGIHYAEIQQRSIILAKPNPVDLAQPFRVYRISKPINGLVTVYAYHISYDLTGIPVSPYSAASVQAALAGFSTYAAVTNPFTFWSDMTASGDFTVKAPASVRSLLETVLEVYGGEYKYDKYTVRLYQQRGVNRGVTIRYGKNLTDLKQDENCSNVYTGVYAYYSDGNGIVETSPKVTPAPGTYDYTRVLPLDLKAEFKEAPTAEALRAAAEQYMSDHNIGVPEVSLNVSFVQLEQTQEYKDLALLERVELCDTVTVIFERLGVNATAQVTSTVYNVLIDAYDSVTIGNVRKNVAMTIAEQAQEIAKGPDLTALQAAVIEATELITGNQGGYVVIHSSTGGKTPDEILIMDQPDIESAVQVWRWNKSGLGYSSSGYNGPYGLAMTIDGKINADFITTGGMDAARITAGILQSKDGRFLIDLTANTITMKNTSGNTVFAFDGNGNLTISGKITATSGSIAGFTIYGDRLQGGNCTLYSDYTNGRLVLGNTVLNGYGGMVAGLNCNAPFTATALGCDDRMACGELYLTGSSAYMGNLTARQVSYSANLRLDTDTGYLYRISSSERYKRNIHDIHEFDSVSDRIDRVRAVTFESKASGDKGRSGYGFIAEEMEQEFPWLTEYNRNKETGMVEAESVSYDRVPAVLWADAQNTHKMLRDMGNRIKQLEEALKNAK
nr:MAG TPA: tail protein [Caudoviricetes sp.]